MLNLLPIRLLMRLLILAVGLATLASAYAGLIGTGDAFGDASRVISWSSSAVVVAMVLASATWRWMPSIQRLTFPYLGGDWTGQLEFDGPMGTGTRDVSLTVTHSLLKIVLILDSAESTSRTLVAQAERDAGINRDRLYYVFVNERKEGVEKGGGDRYRGLAVLRVEMTDTPMLRGNYFTDRQSAGKLELRRRRSNPWWLIWK